MRRSRAEPVAVIGAGIAGLSAARALVARGREVVVFDKGRAPGGRSSTRRLDGFTFDHGAQYFTAREGRFRAEVERWRANGAAARWDGRLVALEGGSVRPAGDDDERFVGTPGMSAPLRLLASGLDVRCDVRVQALARADGVWRLEAEGGAQLGRFAQLLLTAPPAQAAALVGERSALGARAAESELRPCWAVMLAFAVPLELAYDGAFCAESSLAWIARDSSKPGRPRIESWVLHATPAWSEEHLDLGREAVMDALSSELEHVTGATLPVPIHRDAHRWRFASLPATLAAVPGACLHDSGLGLTLAGDWLAGGRIEGAWLSGQAAAAVLD